MKILIDIFNSDVIVYVTFFAMIYMHIKNDFNQGIIASMKQSEWWKDNYPQPMYKDDYKMVLAIHSIEWCISILIFPVLHYIITGGNSLWVIVIAFTLNVVIHAVIDDLKANRLVINLCTDQLVHLLQIFVTWLVLVIIL